MNNNPNNFIPENWYDSNQAARILNYAPGTLANKRVTGDGPPFIKFGGSVYYAKDDIKAFIEQNACSYRTTTEWKEDKT